MEQSIVGVHFYLLFDSNSESFYLRSTACWKVGLEHHFCNVSLRTELERALVRLLFIGHLSCSHHHLSAQSSDPRRCVPQYLITKCRHSIGEHLDYTQPSTLGSNFLMNFSTSTFCPSNIESSPYTEQLLISYNLINSTSPSKLHCSNSFQDPFGRKSG